MLVLIKIIKNNLECLFVFPFIAIDPSVALLMVFCIRFLILENFFINKLFIQ